MAVTHAILSASSAERWITCTPSARLEETMPDRSSSFAADGTAAHAFAELRLRWLLRQVDKDAYVASYEDATLEYAAITADWTHTDWDAINSYVDYVMDETVRLDADVTIEARVDYSRYAQEGFGTSDALLVSRSMGIVKAIDLKFGKGVPVSAVDNTQAKMYVLGGLLGLDPEAAADMHTVEWAIHQPRLDYVGEDSMPIAELIGWAEKVVRPAAELAWEGKGTLVPSDKGCRFCKVAPTCRALIAKNVTTARKDFMEHMTPAGDFDPSEFLLEPEKIAAIFKDIDGWMSWATTFKNYVLSEARDNGLDVPGFKVVRGRSNRAWTPGVDVAAELAAAGVSETSIYPPATAVRSVAQMEKELGKAKFAEVAAPLVTKPLGAPTLVPSDDPRPAMNAAAEAAQAFAEAE